MGEDQNENVGYVKVRIDTPLSDGWCFCTPENHPLHIPAGAWSDKAKFFGKVYPDIAALRTRVAELEAALLEIANSDDIENALDPARNKRVARAALTQHKTEEGL